MSGPRLVDDPEGFTRGVVARLSAGKGVRRQLPGGRLHVDRVLPFLVVYRRPADPIEGAERLVYGQASYLVADGDAALHPGVVQVVRGLAGTVGRALGAYLVVEVWVAPDTAGADPLLSPPRRFVVRGPVTDGTPTTVDALVETLAAVHTPHHRPEVDVVDDDAPAPPDMDPLVDRDAARDLGVLLLGVAVPPFFVDPATRGLLPVVFRRFQRDLGDALRSAAFEFSAVQTSHEPEDPRALGRRAVTAAATEVDLALVEVGAAFDYLLAVTPINADQAWDDFAASGYRDEPAFHYRPLTIDPELLKRRLHAIPVEQVEDPTLAHLFREQRRELDRKLTLLEDRATPAFLHESIQLYGGVDERLLDVAEGLVELVDVAARSDAAARSLDAEAFVALAAREIDHYQQAEAAFDAGVQLRDDVPGVLVTESQLLVGRRYRVAEARADALVAHEVGTHIVTFLNGKAQPVRQLRIGLPGYEETQEGLAVLAEYIAGGLTPARMVLLAARVIATHRLVAGWPFVKVFEELCERLGLAPQRAFDVTMRVFRAGGLTKDAIYLRGLARVLDYLGSGGELDTLFVGKLSLDAVPVVQELLWRQVLQGPLLRPRWIDRPGAAERLAAARGGLSVLDLTERITT